MSGVENCGQAICGQAMRRFLSPQNIYNIFRILFDITWRYCIVHTDLETSIILYDMVHPSYFTGSQYGSCSEEAGWARG